MVNYFISTDDYSVAKRKIEEIEKNMTESFDEITYDLDEDSIFSILTEITTISLFQTPKIIIIKSGEKILNITDEAHKELISAISDYNSNNILIVISQEGYKKDNNNRLEQIKKYATFLDYKIKNISLIDYAKEKIKNDGYEIKEDALDLLISYSDSMTILNSSIDILESYKLDEKKIEKDDILLMIPKPLEDKGYELTNALLKDDKKRVFEIYNDFKTMNALSNIIPMLINKFQQLYNVYSLSRAGVRQDDIANIIGVNKNQAYYLIKDSNNQSIKRIIDNLDYLTNLDMEIKSGRIDSEVGLHFYFLR